MRMRRCVFVPALLATGCTVPSITIEERASSATTADAGSLEDAAVGGSAASAPDAGAKRPTRSGKPAAGSGAQASKAGSGGMAAADGGGVISATPMGSGGNAGEPASSSGAAGAAGGAGSAAPGMLPRGCAVWTMVSVRDSAPPAGAVEGGFETVTGVTNRQYVCRFRPPGGNFTIPGKYVVGLGCYVTYRRDAQTVVDASMLDGMIEVLTPAPGCSFSWRTATAKELPAGVADLGDPAGGRNYACHGDYSTVASSGKQIGTMIASSDNPPQNQCWFESFSNAIQPSDPKLFEVLVQD